jgi:hypothetical protein
VRSTRKSARGTHRNAVELILVPGTRPVDLLRKLNENRPQVVHFSSHGSPDELLLESGDDDIGAIGPSTPPLRSVDDRDMKRVRPEDPAEAVGASQSNPHPVKKSALVSVPRACGGGNLRLVVLNACDTRAHAEALTEIVDCVVSMNRVISDHDAIKFAASFYGALAFGRSVQSAFDQGVARLVAEGIAEADAPELVVRAGVDASKIVPISFIPNQREHGTRHHGVETSKASLASSSELEYLEVERLTDVTVLRFKERVLSNHAVSRARDELAALLNTDANCKFVFRFDVRHATSTMFAALIRLNNRIVDREGKLLFCEVSPPVMEMLRTYSLDRRHGPVPGRSRKQRARPIRWRGGRGR